MIESKAVKTIKTCTMLEPGDHVLVGVSGGADSVALLSVLCGLQKKWHLSFDRSAPEPYAAGRSSTP